MKVVASIFPIYLITKLFYPKVDYLVPPNVNIHIYEPTLKDISKLPKIDYFVGAGYIVNPWEKRITAFSNAKYIDLSKGVKLIYVGKDIDPHYWNSPKQVVYIYEKILKDYFKNDTAFQNLKNLDKTYEKTFKTCKIKTFITTHPAWRYLARDYNLTQISLSLGENYLLPQDLFKIENAIRKYHIEGIISIKGFSSKLIEYLKNKYNLKIYYLNPCIFGNSSSDYIIIMSNNLKIFKKVLKCEEE